MEEIEPETGDDTSEAGSGATSRALTAKLLDQADRLGHVEGLDEVGTAGGDALAGAGAAEIAGHEGGAAVEGGHGLELFEELEPVAGHPCVHEGDVELLLLGEAER